MNLRIRPGYCWITPDLDEDRSKGGILYPTWVRGKPNTGLCVLHAPTMSWDDIDLTNQHVIFDRWAGRPFKLKWSDGKEYEFVNVSQWGILAIVNRDKQETVQ